LEGLAWTVSAMYKSKESNKIEIDNILRHLLNKVNETAETANFVSHYNDIQTSKLVMLHSNKRTDAIILDLLLTMDSKQLSPLIVKIVKGLLGDRVKGRWQSTQENIFCIISLHKYFTIYFASKSSKFCN